MAPQTDSTRRADAARNRERILAAARSVLVDASREGSMAEIARRADVGMATLYRNFAGRQELLEALFAAEVDELCRAAELDAGPSGRGFFDWLFRFAAFHRSKHLIAAELLRHTDVSDPVFSTSRSRVLAAGRPLQEAAQHAGMIDTHLTLEQILDLVLAILAISSDPDYVAPILHTALSGLTPRAVRDHTPDRLIGRARAKSPCAEPATAYQD